VTVSGHSGDERLTQSAPMHAFSSLFHPRPIQWPSDLLPELYHQDRVKLRLSVEKPSRLFHADEKRPKNRLIGIVVVFGPFFGSCGLLGLPTTSSELAPFLRPLTERHVTVIQSLLIFIKRELTNCDSLV